MTKSDWTEIILSVLEGAILLTVLYFYLMKEGIKINPFDFTLIWILTGIAMYIIRVTVKLFQSTNK